MRTREICSGETSLFRALFCRAVVLCVGVAGGAFVECGHGQRRDRVGVSGGVFGLFWRHFVGRSIVGAGMSHKATNWAIGLRGLKPAAKIVLWHLCDRHNPDLGCFPSQDKLAEDCEMARSTVRVHLDTLEEKGLIRRVNGIDQHTKRQLPTRYFFSFEDGFSTEKGDSSTTETKGDSGESRGRNPAPEAVAEKTQKPWPKNGKSRGRNPASNPVREPLREPRARENEQSSVDDDAVTRMKLGQRKIAIEWLSGGDVDRLDAVCAGRRCPANLSGKEALGLVLGLDGDVRAKVVSWHQWISNFLDGKPDTSGKPYRKPLPEMARLYEHIKREREFLQARPGAVSAGQLRFDALVQSVEAERAQRADTSGDGDNQQTDESEAA